MFENNQSINLEYILEKVRTNKIDEIFKNICYIENNYIIIDYVYIKHFATNDTYDLILEYILNNIDKILHYYNNFGVHVNTKFLTLSDIDKHRSFIIHMCRVFKDKYPDKLEKCNIYNAPHIFSHLYSIISMFIDKITQQKIILVKK
jgi:hypothetical protein